MKNVIFKKIKWLFMPLVLLTTLGVGNAWGHATFHTSSVTLTNGSSCSDCSIVIGSDTYSGKKLGTGSKTGSLTFTVPAGTTKLYIHVARWKGDGGALNISASNGTLASSSLSLTSDDGVTGTSTTFTLSKPANATTNYYKTVNISNVTTTSTITLTTSSKRAVIWGVSYGKFTVTYNGNGSTGGTTPTDSDSPYASGETVTVKSNTFTRSGYTFDHWDTKSDDSGTDYAGSGSATFSISANTTLYAQWVSAGTSVSLTKAGQTNGTFT